MKPYAVIETGGKQYRVAAEDTVQVELLDVKDGDEIALTPVLAVSDGSSLTVGKPHVAGAKVMATVVKHTRGPKLISFKMKRRKGMARKKGHRQDLLVLKIKSVTAA